MGTVEKNGARWLLLLPRPPSELTLHALQVAYGPGLTKALEDASLATSVTSIRTTLDIAVAYRAQPRFDFSSLQHLFGTLYKLTCILCTELGIDLQYDNDVDARFFLFDWPLNGAPLDSKDANPRDLLSLQQIAQSRRLWSHICALESEVGEELLQGFLRSRGEMGIQPLINPTVSRLPGGLSMIKANILPPEFEASPRSTRRHHRSVAVGGTFDHLHAGHKLLLTMTAFTLHGAIEERMCLTIGITGDELLNKKQYIEELEGWNQRQATVKAFLLDLLEFIPPSHALQETKITTESDSRGREVVDIFYSGLRIRYAEIFDPYGPTITDPDITALVISAETRAGGDAVNNKRQEKGWSSLEVLQVDVLDMEMVDTQSTSNGDHKDFQNKLSSTEIRSRIHKRRTMASVTG
ncbi:MAG: hypothetical protein Q9217_001992 [Psora testacea]